MENDLTKKTKAELLKYIEVQEHKKEKLIETIKNLESVLDERVEQIGSDPFVTLYHRRVDTGIDVIETSIKALAIANKVILKYDNAMVVVEDVVIKYNDNQLPYLDTIRK